MRVVRNQSGNPGHGCVLRPAFGKAAGQVIGCRPPKTLPAAPRRTCRSKGDAAACDVSAMLLLSTGVLFTRFPIAQHVMEFGLYGVDGLSREPCPVRVRALFRFPVGGT